MIIFYRYWSGIYDFFDSFLEKWYWNGIGMVFFDGFDCLTGAPRPVPPTMVGRRRGHN